MTEHEALSLFDPYLSWFRECWRHGWDRHKQIGHPMERPRARSMCIQSHATIHARETFHRQPGISYQSCLERDLFFLGDIAIFQFKKLSLNPENGHHVPSNNLNPTAEKFACQQEIEGIIAPRITVGYCPNEFHTEFTVSLSQTATPYRNAWFLDITASAVLYTPDLFDLDAQPAQPTRRVIPRRDGPAPGDAAAAQG